jgi:hypothetical protein
MPARDAQTILGHTRISTTLEICTDTDEEAGPCLTWGSALDLGRLGMA